MSKIASSIEVTVAALVFLSIISLVSGQAGASDTVSVDYSIYPEVTKPGTEGYVQVKLVNLGAQPIYDLYLFQVKAESPLKVEDTQRVRKPSSRESEIYSPEVGSS